jgi:hypothetical protein
MIRLKILFITKDQSEQMEKSSYYLAEEMKKHCDLMIWTQAGQMKNILVQLPYKPDFIFLNDLFDGLCPNVYGLSDIRIPKGMIFHDISNKKQQRKLYVVKENIDYVFTHYRDAFKRWYPRLVNRMISFPHHANMDIFKDYQLDKKINWLMMGATSPRLYPLRAFMLQSLKNNPGFVYHPHPGFRHVNDIKPGSLIGKNYAREINRAKMFLTCGSIFEYSLMKYFEVLACNTLLLAPVTKEIADLGFSDKETMVHVTKQNFQEKAVYYLRNKNERMAIAKRGYEMVRTRHSTKQRVRQLLNKMNEIVRG